MSGFVGGSLDDPGILADTLHYSSNRVVHAETSARGRSFFASFRGYALHQSTVPRTVVSLACKRLNPRKPNDFKTLSANSPRIPCLLFLAEPKLGCSCQLGLTVLSV